MNKIWDVLVFVSLLIFGIPLGIKLGFWIQNEWIEIMQLIVKGISK